MEGNAGSCTCNDCICMLGGLVGIASACSTGGPGFKPNMQFLHLPTIYLSMAIWLAGHHRLASDHTNSLTSHHDIWWFRTVLNQADFMAVIKKMDTTSGLWELSPQPLGPTIDHLGNNLPCHQSTVGPSQLVSYSLSTFGTGYL